MALERGVLRDVERKGGLAHARPAGDDDQVGRLQPGGHLVEVDEAGGHAGDQLLALVELLDRLHRVDHDVAHAEERRPRLALGDGEDLVLRLVEELLDVGPRLVARAVAISVAVWMRLRRIDFSFTMRA